MFNPEITEGPWNWKRVDSEKTLFSEDNEKILWSIVSGCTDLGDEDSVFSKNKENEKAIASVPELLEVYKKAKEVIDEVYLNVPKSVRADEISYLEKAIRKLEERHFK